MKQNYPWAAFDDPVMMKIGLKKISNRINLNSVSSFKFLQQIKIERSQKRKYCCGEISLSKCSSNQQTFPFPPLTREAQQHFQVKKIFHSYYWY